MAVQCFNACELIVRVRIELRANDQAVDKERRELAWKTCQLGLLPVIQDVQRRSLPPKKNSAGLSRARLALELKTGIAALESLLANTSSPERVLTYIESELLTTAAAAQGSGTSNATSNGAAFSDVAPASAPAHANFQDSVLATLQGARPGGTKRTRSGEPVGQAREGSGADSSSGILAAQPMAHPSEEPARTRSLEQFLNSWLMECEGDGADSGAGVRAAQAAALASNEPPRTLSGEQFDSLLMALEGDSADSDILADGGLGLDGLGF